MNFEWTFNLAGKSYGFSFQSLKTPDTWTAGITSRVYGTSLHVLLLDYDHIREDFFFNEIEYLQDIFERGNFYLFKTDLKEYTRDSTAGKVRVGNFHAINLEEAPLMENLQILRCTSCEYAFKNAPAYNPEKHWVLRSIPKGERGAPEYLGAVESPYEKDVKRLQSTAHARHIDLLYGTDIEKHLKNPDGNETLSWDYYVTASRTKLVDVK